MNPRVISGIAKGRRLKVVPGSGTRPVTDMVKQALFNIISTNVVDSCWWDLFGGTGAIGIEALSRGAKFARFNEINKLAVDVIIYNLEMTNLLNRSEVIRRDALISLKQPPDRAFDYIYIAPPQYQGIWEKALECLDENSNWLNDYSMAIVQIHPRELKPLALNHFAVVDERKYGSTLLAFFQKK